MTDDDHARVRCYAADKDRLNDRKQGEDTQADVIRRLLDGQPGEATADCQFAVDVPDGGFEDFAALLADLEQTVEQHDGGGSLTFDDIKAACAAAIRDELGEVLQR